MINMKQSFAYTLSVVVQTRRERNDTYYELYD